MIFPLINSSTSGSLLANLGSSLRTLGREESPPLYELFGRIGNLAAGLPTFNPGTTSETRELIQVVYLKRDFGDLSDVDKAAYVMMEELIVDRGASERPKSNNVDDSLSEAYPQSPDFDDFIGDLTYLMIQGQLVPPTLFDFHRFLKRHFPLPPEPASLGYRYLERLRRWIAIHERKTNGITSDATSFLAESREFCRSLLHDARMGYRQTSDPPRVANARSGLLQLWESAAGHHEERCAILEEAYLMSEIRELLARFRQTLDLPETSSSQDLIETLNRRVDDWVGQRQQVLEELPDLHPLVTRLNEQLRQSFNRIDRQFPHSPHCKSHSTLAEVRSSSERRTREIDSLLAKLSWTERSLQGDPDRELLLCAAGVERRYYALNRCDAWTYHLLAQVSWLEETPGILTNLGSARASHAIAPGLSALTAFNRYLYREYHKNQCFWPAIARFPAMLVEFLSQSLDLYSFYRDSRNEGYSLRSERLNAMLAQKRLTSTSKKRLETPIAPIVASRKPMPISSDLDFIHRWKTAQGPLSNAEFRLKGNPSPRPRSPDSPLAAVFQQALMQPFPFDFHRTVTRWRHACLPLDARLYPEFASSTPEEQGDELARFRFFSLADAFLHHCEIIICENSDGADQFLFALPAELIADETRRFGCLIWAVDAENSCFYRAFEETSMLNFNERILSREFKAADFSIPKPSDLAALPIGDFGELIESGNDATCEFDPLLKTATLTGLTAERWTSLRLYLFKEGDFRFMPSNSSSDSDD